MGNIRLRGYWMPAFAGMTAVLLAGGCGSSHAQSVEDFYKGKSINLLIGFSVGGGYDLYARHLAGQILWGQRQGGGGQHQHYTHQSSFHQHSPKGGGWLGRIAHLTAPAPV